MHKSCIGHAGQCIEQPRGPGLAREISGWGLGDRHEARAQGGRSRSGGLMRSVFSYMIPYNILMQHPSGRSRQRGQQGPPWGGVLEQSSHQAGDFSRLQSQRAEAAILPSLRNLR